jgi:hypothetical protein
MNLGEQSLQLRLKGLLFRSLVVLAEKVSARLECVEGECQGSHAQVLSSSAGDARSFQMPYHAPCVVSERVAAGVHHPKIWVTKALLVEAGRLVPGF